MRRKTALRITFLFLALVVAAASAVMLIDPWNWLDGGVGAAAEPAAFPGIEKTLLLPAADRISPQPFNVLILGLDHGLGRVEQGNQRSDAIIIAHIDEAKGRACLLSIPRDSYVNIPGHNRTKINEA